MFNHVDLNGQKPPKLIQQNINGTRMYVTPEGLALPSVTTVVGSADIKKNIALKKWREREGEAKSNAIKQVATSRGKSLHKACELYLLNESDYLKNVKHDAKEMFLDLKPFLHRINNIHFQETTLYSINVGLAGTVDCIAEFDGVLSVIDFKNSRRIRTEDHIFTYFLQETAYGLMYNEWLMSINSSYRIRNIVTLMAVENEEPQLFVKDLKTFVTPLFNSIKKYQEYQRSICTES